MGWTLDPSEFSKMIESDLTERQRAIALTALTGIVYQSPVDKGVFRGSHNLSIGQPDYNYNPNNADKTGQATISKGISKLNGLVPFTTVYIQTNAPQAMKIEYGTFTEKPETVKTINGYSKQAPKGLYGLTFQLVQEKYK